MRQILISKDTFRTHPALASKYHFSHALSFSFLLITLTLWSSITYFFVFTPVKSFTCDICVSGGGRVCIWLLGCNRNGPEARVTASSSSFTAQHPPAQGRLAYVYAAYWRVLTRSYRVGRASTTSTAKGRPKATATPQALPGQVGHLAAQPSGVTCALRARAQALTVSLAAATGMGSSPLPRGGSSNSGTARSEGSALGSPYSW